jgi:hypothetical protein
MKHPCLALNTQWDDYNMKHKMRCILLIIKNSCYLVPFMAKKSKK